jgi:hypothetical protein
MIDEPICTDISTRRLFSERLGNKVIWQGKLARQVDIVQFTFGPKFQTGISGYHILGIIFCAFTFVPSALRHRFWAGYRYLAAKKT